MAFCVNQCGPQCYTNKFYGILKTILFLKRTALKRNKHMHTRTRVGHSTWVIPGSRHIVVMLSAELGVGAGATIGTYIGGGESQKWVEHNHGNTIVHE